MADNTLSSWANFLFEMQAKTVQVFPTEAPFLAELSGVGDPNTVNNNRITPDGNREVFSGKFVRVPIVLAQLPGGGYVTEGQTWNVPQKLGTTEAHINLVDLIQPFSLSVDVERDSFNNSAAAAVETLTDQARIALARLENWGLLGDGTGKVSDITNAATSLTIQVSTTGTAPMDILLPGTVWDVLTKSNGANPGNGLRRLIASVSDSATTQTVTFDTASQASDGNSGSITFSTNEGIYIPGSFSTAGSGPAPQGLEQVAAVTGTFENINKASVQQWQGTDGRIGDTTTLPLSQQMLDKAVRIGRRAGLGKWDFGIGDPAAIDLFKQGLYSQVRYEPQNAKLNSGFPGIVYDGADAPIVLVKEPSHKKGGIKLVDKSAFQMYGDKAGPSFLVDDGAMFRRFARTLVKEAELLDRFQMGVKKCNTTVFLNNLQQAS